MSEKELVMSGAMKVFWPSWGSQCCFGACFLSINCIPCGGRCPTDVSIISTGDESDWSFSGTHWNWPPGHNGMSVREDNARLCRFTSQPVDWRPLGLPLPPIWVPTDDNCKKVGFLIPMLWSSEGQVLLVFDPQRSDSGQKRSSHCLPQELGFSGFEVCLICVINSIIQLLGLFIP